MLSVTQPFSSHRYRTDSGFEALDANVIAEASVALMVNGEPWLSFSCTPTNLDALAVGFLYNESIIEKKDELEIVDIGEQGARIDIWLNKSVERPQNWQRTSGCTGGFTSVPPSSASANNSKHISPATLLSCMEQLFQSQDLYREAGGVHTSIASDGEKTFARAEDIGRHNTLDKLAGRLLLDGVERQPLIVATTGRISAEMLQKSSRLGAIAVISRTSPTSQSVATAEKLGITLAGYARRDTFMVYANPWRLTSNLSDQPVLQPGETHPGG